MRRNISYFLAYLSIGLAAFALLSKGINTWIFPIYAFGIIPNFELFIKEDSSNYSQEVEKKKAHSKFNDWLVYLIVPAQWTLLILFLFSVQKESSLLELTGKIASFGLASGVFGINVGHELGHRVKKSEQFLAKALLLTSQYMHFFIEHNKGHHLYVATKKDPATSRFNEWLYIFWFRSIIRGYISAWRIEIKRLRKKNLSILHWSNEMIWYIFFQLVLLLSIFFVFDLRTMILYFIAAFAGILLLETVNYIEHYGLLRKQKEDGSYVSVKPVHSWNSDHPLGRGILFELSRHSDHHYRASRKYQILRHFDEPPQLPTGYPGMMVLSAITPLWFPVMNRRVKKLRKLHPDLLAD